MKDLNKRKWKPVLTSKGKFYCGYSGYLDPERLRRAKAKERDEPHQVQSLHIKPISMGRGRSSISFYFEDETGHKYEMSAKGMLILNQLFCAGIVTPSDKLAYGIHVDVIQVKQGTQYSIEVVG